MPPRLNPPKPGAPPNSWLFVYARDGEFQGGVDIFAEPDPQKRAAFMTEIGLRLREQPEPYGRKKDYSIWTSEEQTALYEVTDGKETRCTMQAYFTYREFVVGITHIDTPCRRSPQQLLADTKNAARTLIDKRFPPR